MPPLDLFDLMDVPRREDSYSSVLSRLLHHSPQLRRQVLAHGFAGSAPVLIDAEIEFRSALPDGAGVPDLLIRGHDAQHQRWELFIENKIDASESPGQTLAYFDALRRRVGVRAAGIYLTLDGHAPKALQVMPLRHAELGRWVAASMGELNDPVLRMAAEAYVRRACAPFPQARPDEYVRGLLEPPTGLLPWNAGADMLGGAIVAAVPGWSHTPITIQGPGHGNLGLQFHREGWRGTPISEGVFKSDNLNIHTELELVWDSTWRLKLHFETEPYMKGRWLSQIDGVADFEAMRDVFRKSMHAHRDGLPGWRMTNYRLQVCVFETDLSAESTVGEVVDVLAKAMTSAGPIVDEVLRSTKG